MNNYIVISSSLPYPFNNEADAKKFALEHGGIVYLFDGEAWDNLGESKKPDDRLERFTLAAMQGILSSGYSVSKSIVSLLALDIAQAQIKALDEVK